MTKKLYYLRLSPPARAVALTAAALGIELELIEVNLLAGEHYKPEFLKLNPQHTIPVLDDNGVIVTDSHAICAYLVDKYGVGNEKLYPKDLAKRALVNSRLHYDSGHLFCRLRFLFEPVFYEKYHELCPSRIEYLQRTYESLDRFVADSPYVCGQDMTIADLCLIATLSSLLKVAPVDETKYSNLIQWIERMKKLPYYEETNGIGAEELQQAVIECIKKNNVAQ